MSREFDIIVYGATGFTGQYVANELKILNEKMTPINFAIAGRSESGLNKIKEKFGLNVPSIVVDVSNVDGLRAMAKRATIVINCVGPFRELGLPVVTACVEEGTNYVDICGEPEFLELVQLELSDKAKQTGATVVTSCGFDSIPADVGMEHAVRAMRATGREPLSVESFLNFNAGESGLCVHYTTYKCAVEGFGRVDELRKVRKGLEQKRNGLTLSRPEGPKLKLEAGPFDHPFFPGQSVFAFPGADASVCRRTQLEQQEDSADYRAPYHACYFNVPSEHKLKMVMYGGAFQQLAKWGWGRSLLLSQPGFFTNGIFTHEGPTEQQMKEASFRIEFIVRPTDGSAPLVTAFTGPDPGYIGTSSLISCAALTILEAKAGKHQGVREKALKGGVFTPGYAFGASDELLQKLEQRAFKAEVLPEGTTQLTQDAAAEERNKALIQRVNAHNGI